ncbi:thioredoxin family protein [Bacillus solimangrovi]|uniref:Thiol reductase thioredoxin n=1 Tax=Bacillus solimangrovi TaxID=1305675 RepID=A0A1E5LCH9_9BACI|nr:thioredoxin family protein [Bacillus solimangrovi]OEH91783.1 thiol reductase thioredoxin [Bacillus solimangrovi]
MISIESKEMFETVKNKESVIFLFSADWCPDCRVIEPFLPDLEKKYDKYKFYYVDRDEFIDICVELDIFGIPSFLAFEKGEELGRFVSKDRKTQEQIEDFIESL